LVGNGEFRNMCLSCGSLSLVFLSKNCLWFIIGGIVWLWELSTVKCRVDSHQIEPKSSNFVYPTHPSTEFNLFLGLFSQHMSLHEH